MSTRTRLLRTNFQHRRHRNMRTLLIQYYCQSVLLGRARNNWMPIDPCLIHNSRWDMRLYMWRLLSQWSHHIAPRDTVRNMPNWSIPMSRHNVPSHS